MQRPERVTRASEIHTKTRLQRGEIIEFHDAVKFRFLGFSSPRAGGLNDEPGEPKWA